VKKGLSDDKFINIEDVDYWQKELFRGFEIRDIKIKKAI